MTKIKLVKDPLKTLRLDDNLANSLKFKVVLSAILLIFAAVCCYFTSSNEVFYNKTLAKIVSVSETLSSQTTQSGENEPMKTQKISALILNGTHKGYTIQLENKTSFSQVYDINLQVNDEVFIKLQEDNNHNIISSKITDYKRDKYIVYISFIFIMLILVIGGIKGFKSLASVVLNILIFLAVNSLFLKGYNLIMIAIIASLLFITLSIFIVGGVNKKTISAILGTLIGTFVSFLIAIVVMKLCNSNGIHYEEMEFLTHPPEKIFLIEILIGTLGGIMDIAISISSSMNEIFDLNPNIEITSLIKSGLEIGKDIMGTMSNTLVFAYISGSIPIVLLVLRNKFPFSYVININLSLEIIRALTGSIGIVLSIPVTIYTSVLLIKGRKIGEHKL